MVSKKISTTLLIWFTLVVFIPLLSFLFLENYHFSRFFKQMAYENLQTVANKQAYFIDYWFQEKINIVRLIADSSSIKSENLQEMNSYFINILENYPDYSSVAFVDAKGKLMVDPNNKIGIDVADRPYFQAAQQGKEYISDVLISRQSGEPIIIFSVPVFANEKFKGLILGSVYMNKIGEIMHNTEEQHEQDTYLVNKKGYMITESDLTKDSSVLEVKVDTLGVTKALAKQSGIGEYKDYRGREVLGAYRWLPESQWILLAEIDKRMAFAPIYNYYQLALGGFLLLILILFISFKIFLVHRIANPLRQLTGMAAQVAAGNFTTRIPSFPQKNEIGFLALSFNQMAHFLQKQQETNEKIMQELSEKNKQLKTLAIIDAMTGLYNKGHLLKLLESEFERAIRYSYPLVVIMLDIDYFKKVNDTYGHLTGDKVLQDLARIILKPIRQSDIIARYGGEEFTIIAPHTGLEQGMILAEKVRLFVENYDFKTEEGMIIPITISLGVSVFEGDRQDNISSAISGVIEKADKALYQAKSNGRNRVEKF